MHWQARCVYPVCSGVRGPSKAGPRRLFPASAGPHGVQGLRLRPGGEEAEADTGVSLRPTLMNQETESWAGRIHGRNLPTARARRWQSWVWSSFLPQAQPPGEMQELVLRGLSTGPSAASPRQSRAAPEG